MAKKSSGHITIDHDEIKNWVEARGGHPATVKGTSRGKAGVLRIDYPGYKGEKSLQEISWDDFFEKFESDSLAFLYQEKTASGRKSRFSKIVRDHSGSRTERKAA